MKRTLLLIVTLTLTLSLICAAPSYAEDDDGTRRSGEYVYTVVDDCAWIIDTENSMSGDVAIPAKLGGYPVERIMGGFNNNDAITGAVIPEGVTFICDAFYNCSSLKSVKIPASVDEIYGGMAFCECPALSEVELPDSPVMMQSGIFRNCAVINDPANNDNGAVYVGNHLIKTSSDQVKGNYAIKEGTKSVASYAFGGCSKLTGVTIPESVGSIGEEAFASTELYDRLARENESVYIGNWLIYAGRVKTSEFKVREGTVGLAAKAFKGNEQLRKIELPESLRYICCEAFSGCGDLTGIDVPEGVESIPNMAFFFCMSLKEITIPASVKRIGHLAFEVCSELESVFYLGTDAQWKQIAIGDTNEYLINAARFDVFRDVAAKKWYTDAAVWCNSNGYITGTGNNMFSPDGALTRAMFIQILARVAGADLDGCEYTARFTDVPNGKWYTKAVEWAAQNGVTSGKGNGLFDPNGKVTREQLATFFFAYSNNMGYDTNASADLSWTYSDAQSVSGWAERAVSWAVAEKLITGTTDITLSPRSNATRAQAAVIFKNFAEKYVSRQTAGE